MSTPTNPCGPCDELVHITKAEYESLLKDRNWLTALEAAGVDNWDGYDFAREIYQEDFA